VTAGNNLTATVENGKSLTTQKGYIYVYSDNYQSKLLGACRVEVQAANLLTIKVKAGEEYDYYLKVFNPIISDEIGMKERIVEVFSTDSQLIYPPGGKQRNTFRLLPLRKDPQHIPIALMSRSHGTSKAKVNVVDVRLRKIVESFLVVVEAEKPQIDQAFSIQCTKGQQNFYKMKYKNPFDEELAVFTISTSNAALIQPKTSSMRFQPNEEKDICFFLPQQSILKAHEAIVHLNRVQEDPEAEEEDKRKSAKQSSFKGSSGKRRDGQVAPVKEFEAYSESILFKIVVSRTAQEPKKPVKPQKEVEVQHVVAQPVVENVEQAKAPGKEKGKAGQQAQVEEAKIADQAQKDKKKSDERAEKKAEPAKVEDKKAGKQDSSQKKKESEPVAPKKEEAKQAAASKLKEDAVPPKKADASKAREVKDDKA